MNNIFNIFSTCDRLNIQFSLYRSSSLYGGEMRWSATFTGGDDHVKLEAEATAIAGDAAIELAWHRFQKLASGQLEAVQAIAATALVDGGPWDDHVQPDGSR